MRKTAIGLWIAIAAVVLPAASVSALVLAPGDVQYKPGTSPALPLPYYDTVLPAYFTAGNQQATTSSTYVTAIGNLNGLVTSTVYSNPANGHLGFKYEFSVAVSLPQKTLIRATINDILSSWTGVTIFSAGSDGSGSSTAAGSPSWTNGDPYDISRELTVNGEGIAIDWKVTGNGTGIAGGQFSARIFVDTNGTDWRLADVGLNDSGSVSSAKAFAPEHIIPSPEPTIGAFFGLGGALLLAYRRRPK